MVKLFGAALIVGCCTFLGLGTAGRSRQRTRALRSLLAALERMENELEGLLTPLPELFALLTRQAAQPASEMFGNVLWLMEERDLPLRAAWARAAEETEALCLLPEEARALGALGASLGRFDAETQARAVAGTRKRLGLFLELEEKDRGQKNKVSAALGAGAGLALAILLL